MKIIKKPTILESVNQEGSVQKTDGKGRVEVTATQSKADAVADAISDERAKNVAKRIKDSGTVEAAQAVADQTKEKGGRKVKALRLSHEGASLGEALFAKDRKELAKIVLEARGAGKRYRVSKAMAEGYRWKVLRESEEATFRGVPGTKFIWHGEWSDPEIIYKGKSLNYWDVENGLWAQFLEDTGHKDSESGDPKVEAEFNEYCQNNVSYLDDIIAGMESVKEGCEDKELKEAPVMDLKPEFDSRKSFYGKASVDAGDNGVMTLWSYNTPVCRIETDKDGNKTATLLRRGYLGWSSSATTLRHVKEFLKQNGFETGSKSELEKMYKVEQA